MDAFAESVLERARLRSKMLQDLGGGVTASTGTPSNKNRSPKSSLISKTKISTVMPGSPKIQHNVLNFQQEHFDMEIKLASKDKCLVQVEIHEQGNYGDTDDDDSAAKSSNLREESKYRLRRLGKLYTEDSDVEMSSPIYPRTEEKVADVYGSNMNGSNISQLGRNKLAALAQNIHQWENESPLPKANAKHQRGKPSSTSSHQPPAKEIIGNEQKNMLELNDSVVKALECQGYTREHLYNTKKKLLTYKFCDGINENTENEEMVIVEKPKVISCKPFVPGIRLIEEEKRTPRGGRPSIHRHSNNNPPTTKENRDPSALSLHERRAIFERNADKTPLMPRAAAFALNSPLTNAVGSSLMNKNKVSNKQTTEEGGGSHKMAETPQNDAGTSSVVVMEKTLTVIDDDREDSGDVRGQGGIVSHRLNALQSNRGRVDHVTISQQQIEDQIREEKQRDMDLLLNRFQKKPPAKVGDNIKEAGYEVKATSQKRERERSEKEVKPKNNSISNLHNLSGCSAQVQSVLEDVREIRVRRNSQQLHNTNAAATQRLYPILSDLETGTDPETETDDNDGKYHNIDNDYNDEEKDNECMDVTYHTASSTTSSSFSTTRNDDDDKADSEDDCCSGPTPPKCGKVLFKSPPIVGEHKTKRNGRDRDSYCTPTHVVDGDTVLPLQHTVSFYRKQQQSNNNTAVTPTAVKKIIRQPPLLNQREQQKALDSILAAEANNSNDGARQRQRQIEVDKRIAELRQFITMQEKTVAQASRALTLCNARLEFNGSTEQVEAERLLLLAAHRRQAALYEIGRVQVKQQQLLEEESEEEEENNDVRGELRIGRMTLPLKMEYVRALGAAGGNGHHVVALVKCDDAKQQVIATRLVSTASTSTANTIDCIVELISQPSASSSSLSSSDLKGGGVVVALESVRDKSTVTIEVYCLQAHDQHLPHHVKYHIKQPQSASGSGSGGGATPSSSSGKRLLMTGLMMRSGGGSDGGKNRMIQVPVESPGGPNMARTSSFALMGYAIFTVRSLLDNNNGGRKQFTLSATPQMSPLEGSVEVGGIGCRWEIPPIQRRGFLTMYEDVTGFGAWHRRWFRLDGGEKMVLRYWKYPDDEQQEHEGRVIELDAFEGNVGLVAREVCARLHTLLLQRKKQHSGEIIDDGNQQRGRYLLSADTKEERIGWCNDLNRVLNAAIQNT